MHDAAAPSPPVAGGGRVGLSAEWSRSAGAFPATGSRISVGWTFIGCGLVASTRRPESRTGALMTAEGFTWFFGNFADSGRRRRVGGSTHDLALRGPLVHLVLAYPRGALVAALAGFDRRRLRRGDRDPVWNGRGCGDRPGRLLVAVSVREYARSVGRSRRARLSPCGSRVGLGLALAGAAVARLAVPEGNRSTLRPSRSTRRCASSRWPLRRPAAASWERAAVTDLVVELGEVGPGRFGMGFPGRSVIPTLEVGYWLPDGAHSSTPRVARSPSRRGAERSVTMIERDGQPVAALVHDPKRAERSRPLEAVSSAAQLAASNARLQAEVRARVVELRASRRRILEAGDEERRRLERRLHDGAERRLEGLSQTSS